MPIYDWNGSASTEIGKIYDWNLSANTQIGKVYDWNGTTCSLIYIDDLVIASGSTFSIGYSLTKQNGSWLSSVSGTTVHQPRPDQPSAGEYLTSAYILLPSSGFSTVDITFTTVSTASFGGIPGSAAATIRTSLASLRTNEDWSNELINGALGWCGNTWGGNQTSATKDT